MRVQALSLTHVTLAQVTGSGRGGEQSKSKACHWPLQVTPMASQVMALAHSLRAKDGPALSLPCDTHAPAPSPHKFRRAVITRQPEPWSIFVFGTFAFSFRIFFEVRRLRPGDATRRRASSVRLDRGARSDRP